MKKNKKNKLLNIFQEIESLVVKQDRTKMSVKDKCIYAEVQAGVMILNKGSLWVK